MFLRRWLPVVVWVLVILAASTEFGSGNRTMRLLEPIFRWFDPKMPWSQIYDLNIVVRKTAHVIEFAILAILLWRTRDFLTAPRRPWAAYLPLTRNILIATSLLAIISELVQYTTNNRAATLRDVLLNAGGAALGLLLVLTYKFRPWQGPKKPANLPGKGR